ncbi:MAG: ATP synthase F1 subunit delta [Halothermotrichaceae bacterium]
MIQNEIARKYSQAIFELGRENDKLDYGEELRTVVKAVNDYPELKQILYHPRVLPEDKQEMIGELFDKELSKTVINFINLLIDKRREIYLEQIYRDYRQLLNKEKDIIEIEVVSAVELSRQLTDKLKDKLNQIVADKTIRINKKVDSNIIGGMKLKIGDKVIDGSISHKLNSLKEDIKQIPVSELGV